MIHRIEVVFKPETVDALGESVARSVREDLGLSPRRVRTVAVYTTNAEFSKQELERLGNELFADPVIQRYSVDRPLYGEEDFDWLLEVGYRPGVTDNVGHSAAEGVQDMLGREFGEGEGFFTSRQYLFEGEFSRADLERIAGSVLANDLIERWQIISREDWRSGARMSLSAPVVTRSETPAVRHYDLEVPDSELIRISERGILSLELAEMKAIQAFYRDPQVRSERKALGLPLQPTDVELECIAQTWSEHCKHKIFNCTIDYSAPGETNPDREPVQDLYPQRHPRNRQPGGLAGLGVSRQRRGGEVRRGLRYRAQGGDPQQSLALDPYGGAITGIVGVNRDILGTGIGCRMIFNTDVFCFARPDWDQPLPGRLSSPETYFQGRASRGADGGNQSGIPTVNGAIVFDDRYRGKPWSSAARAGLSRQ